ncbi:MAG: hypothetical protein OSJ70_04090 [Bacilli bacterium]|nr:hypothetical protein [Bacilli bacterium]
MIKLLGQINSDKDRTKKWIFEKENAGIIEISLISTKTKDIVYVPTHYNCPLGCQNCNIQGICSKGDLKPIDFQDLMDAIDEMLLAGDKRQTSNTNIIISFRGVGEPLLNMPLLDKMYNGQYNLERLGYFNVGFEISTMMPNENLRILSQYIKSGKYPIRVIYRLSSPLDDKLNKLTPASTSSVDASLSYLKMFKDDVSTPEIRRLYRKVFGNKSPVEIFYSIIPEVNDSLFELANLQYFQNRFAIPVVFLKNNAGEKAWVQDILKHYPEANLSITSSYGRDIGCEHGEFDERIYDNSNIPNKIASYEDIANKYHDSKKSTVKKVLNNKVV